MRIVKIISLFLIHAIYFVPVMIFALIGIIIAIFTHRVLKFKVGYDISKTKLSGWLMSPMLWVEDKCIDAIIK